MIAILVNHWTRKTIKDPLMTGDKTLGRVPIPLFCMPFSARFHNICLTLFTHFKSNTNFVRLKYIDYKDTGNIPSKFIRFH